ncbi:hypothetical protein OHQ88_13210 [Micromonospora zamorensis]|uniref:Uncharacterized protein n=1 Tax=Micromonospora zamorensis TaxID=709883 RepID=A0ABZ1PMH1_9ACTN|nr:MULTISPECIES: hypothetical protein [Micromonospora]WTE89141.1 hypothetical protein OHA01_10810 [Micromonospora zamorensis]
MARISGKRTGGLGLDDTERLDGGAWLARRGGDAGLGADRHRRRVVGNGVVQVAGEPLTTKNEPITASRPEPQRNSAETRRTRKLAVNI